MTDRETFLERWSRRKREAGEPPEQLHTAKIRQPVNDRATVSPPALAAEKPVADSAPLAAPEFDLTKLPPIESITAATDVRVFLAPGVPQHLARAALRRAWACDPAIRDFVGLQDYDWDFVTPGAIPGFGELAANDDVRKMLCRLLGEADEPSTQTELVDRKPDQSRRETAQERRENEQEMPALPAQTTEFTTYSGANRPSFSAASAVEPTIKETRIVRRDNITAAQREHSQDQFQQLAPRPKHGSALPK